jgi:hypothetical protein
VDASRICHRPIGMWSGADLCPALSCGESTCRGPLWKSADRVHYAYSRSRRHPLSWFSRPRLLDRLPHNPPLTPPHPPTAPAAPAVMRPRLDSCRPRLSPSAPRRPGAILFASAIATSILGFRAIIRGSHDPAGEPRLAAHRTTAIAPMINSRFSNSSGRCVLPLRHILHDQPKPVDDLRSGSICYLSFCNCIV